MTLNEDPPGENRSDPQFQQSILTNVEARDIQIESIVQKIVYLGIPPDSPLRPFALIVSISLYLALLIVGFVLLWRDGAGFVPLLLLVLGSGLLSLTCLYYAWFWKPEVRDRSLPINEGSSADGLVNRQGIRQRSRQRIRRLAIIGFLLIPLLTCAGFFGWQSLPSQELLVLIADFQGPSEGNFSEENVHLGTKFREKLKEAIKKYPENYSDVKVDYLGTTITNQQGSDVARAEGEKKKATIVIWGWYGVPIDSNITVNFELLRSPTYFPTQAGGSTRDIPTLMDRQTLATSELNSFELPTDLNKTSYFTLFTMGMVRYADGDWDVAIKRFNDALAQLKSEASVSDLNQGVVNFYRGVCFYNQGDYNQAIVDYTQALNFNPDFVAAYNNRGNTYAEQGNFNKALRDYNKALDLNPELAEAYNGRGFAYANKKEYIKALEDFNKAIALKPDNAEAYNGLGRVYVEQRNFSEAILKFNESIELNPKLVAPYSNRGIAYVSQGRYNKAFADYNKAIELDPSFVGSYVNRGNVYVDQDNLNEALADFNKALQLNQNLSEAYIGLGNIYGKKGNFTQALVNFNKAIELKSDNAEAYNGRGVSYAAQMNYDQAIANYNKAIEFKPDFSEAYNNRGNAQYDQANYSEAIVDYNQAIKLNQSNTSAYNGRGATYVKQGEYPQALKDFNKVIEINPNSAVAYYNKAVVYSLERDSKAAIKSLKQAIQLNESLRENVKTDSDFDNIRQDEGFQALLKK